MQMISPQTLLRAYRNGIFPMAPSRDEPVEWYSADPRGIIELPKAHYSRRLLRVIRQKQFTVKIDSDFDTIIQNCAQRSETWISGEIIESYTNLHHLGYAHSVETYSLEGDLIGGLYGVALQGAFFGESMFHTQKYGSKLALYHLIEHLKERKYELLDIQMLTPVTIQFGAVNIPREQYIQKLTIAMKVNCTFNK